MAKFATALNCIDGRIQIPVIEYLKKNYNVDYVDIISRTGMDKKCSSNDQEFLEEIKKSVEISVYVHFSKVIAIVGHHDCAGNPVDQATHFIHIKQAIKNIEKWGFDVEIIGLWVNENWEVSEVK